MFVRRKCRLDVSSGRHNEQVLAHLVDTATVAAGELVLAAGGRRRTVESGSVLVRPIHTVWVAVTHPLARDTLCSTPSFVCSTRKLCLLVTLALIYNTVTLTMYPELQVGITV